MTRRVVTAAAGVTMAAVLLTGCLGTTPEPTPTPTPTGVFASEEEAFAAAEETYRAYNDADNARREDGLSEPDPQSFLIGEALEADLEARREFEQLGIRLQGPSVIRVVTPVSADPVSGDVTIEACYDSTEARVMNAAGEDVTISERDPTILLSIELVSVGDELAIERLVAVEGGSC